MATTKNNVGGAPVKIVIINTQYVQTDASSFKSVVQKLTGKNSVVAVEEPQPVAASYNGSCHGSNNYWEGQNAGGGGPSLGRLTSFNEIDKLFKELPPLDDLRVYAEELQQQHTQYNFIDEVWK